MTRETEKRVVPWSVIAIAVAMIAWGLAMYLLTDTRATVCSLQSTKLDRTEYYNAHNDLKERLKEILSKLDKVADALAEHERNSKR